MYLFVYIVKKFKQVLLFLNIQVHRDTQTSISRNRFTIVYLFLDRAVTSTLKPIITLTPPQWNIKFFRSFIFYKIFSQCETALKGLLCSNSLKGL